MDDEASQTTAVRFDGENSYPDCEQCGWCCRITVAAWTAAEVERVRAYMDEHGVVPRDRGRDGCPLQGEDGGCMVWEARPQICRLYNCHVPRRELLRLNPDLRVPDDPPLIDLRDCFILGDASDPRYR